MIGSLGNVIFEVSGEQLRTFDDFSRDGNSRFAKHDVLGIKPVKQFIGPDLDKIKFKIHLSAALGVNPVLEIETLREYMQNGESLTLIIGGKPVGSGKYTIESINENWTVVDNRGNIISVDVDLELEEYVPDISKTFAKIKSKTSAKQKGVNKKIVKKKVVRKPKKQIPPRKVQRKSAMLGKRMGGYEPID